MIDTSRAAYEAYCDAEGIDTGRTDAHWMAWAKIAKEAALYRFIRDDLYSHDCQNDFNKLAGLHGGAFDSLIELEYCKHHQVNDDGSVILVDDQFKRRKVVKIYDNYSTKNNADDNLSDFKDGQWWVDELDLISKIGQDRTLTITQNLIRAVAVVHNLLQVIEKSEGINEN